MTELNSSGINQIVSTVKDENQRTREAVMGMRQDFKEGFGALPANIALAIKAAEGEKQSVIPSTSTSTSLWVVATFISAIVALSSVLDGRVTPVEDRQTRQENAMIVDDRREAEDSKVLASLQSRVEQLTKDKDNLYDIVARYRIGQVTELQQENAALKQQILELQREQREQDEYYYE